MSTMDAEQEKLLNYLSDAFDLDVNEVAEVLRKCSFDQEKAVIKLQEIVAIQENEIKKPMLLVLNKVDLVDRKIVDAWIDYFTREYPSLKIICFSSFRPINDDTVDLDVTVRRKFAKGRKRYESAGGKRQLIQAIQSFDIVKNGVSISSQLSEELDRPKTTSSLSPSDLSDDSDYDDSEDDDQEEDVESEEEPESSNLDSILIVGTVGHPNVGKSSLINGLMGKKVVSTSRTPGHTKHFQTIFLTKDIQLCDCPGLVFPALDRPKQLQILCGLFPIAQVREPFSAIRYLAERVPVEVALAMKRGYLLAKSGKPDVHRAGLELLKDCVDEHWFDIG
eukprot:gene15303-18123_t